MFLLTLLSGCKSVQTEYIDMPIPASLTQENLIPIVLDDMTWGQCPILYIQAANELKQCNADKEAIREINNFY